MTTFTREQLAAVVHDRATVIHDGGSFSLNVQDLAAFTLAQVERVEDLERTLSTAIKNHLCEVDKRKQAETISAGNLARAEKAEAERDDANDERDDAVARWSRRAREAEAACKELLQVQIEQDRLREKLRKCVEAADAFFLVEDAMSNATEEGVGKDLWIESQEHRNSYDAARAEVGE